MSSTLSIFELVGSTVSHFTMPLTNFLLWKECAFPVAYLVQLLFDFLDLDKASSPLNDCSSYFFFLQDRLGYSSFVLPGTLVLAHRGTEHSGKAVEESG